MIGECELCAAVSEVTEFSIGGIPHLLCERCVARSVKETDVAAHAILPSRLRAAASEIVRLIDERAALSAAAIEAVHVGKPEELQAMLVKSRLITSEIEKLCAEVGEFKSV